MKFLTKLHQLDHHKCNCFLLVAPYGSHFVCDLWNESFWYHGNLLLWVLQTPQCGALTCSVCSFPHQLHAGGGLVSFTEHTEDATCGYVVLQLQRYNAVHAAEQQTISNNVLHPLQSFNSCLKQLVISLTLLLSAYTSLQFPMET